MTATDLLILALATAYVSHVVTATAGPFGVFARLRTMLPLGGLTSCVWCLSVWVAAALWLMWASVILQPVVTVFALAGGALMLTAYTGMKHV